MQKLLTRFKNVFFNLVGKVKSLVDKLSKKRQINTDTYKATNLMLVLAFPIFLTIMVEIIQMKSISGFVRFLFNKPNIVLFSVMFITLIYIALVLLFKKVHYATLIEGLAFGTLSVVELFKFNTNGNHLILTDMKMAPQVKNLKAFAYIKITPMLVICVSILFLYLIAVFWFNPVVKLKLKKRIAFMGVSLACVISILFLPSVGQSVYSFFELDTTDSDNQIVLNEKFDNNNFIAFLAQTTTDGLSKRIKEPEDYSRSAYDELLDKAEKPANNFKKPNVITIMSESFCDFRMFNQLNIDSSIYKNYDNIKAKSFSSEAIVPTFGSFTVKTEHELIFGLPVKSLNDNATPQELMIDRPQVTIPAYYQSLGYKTSYIHPYLRTFYFRDTIYKNYGFDNMHFDDNMLVDIPKYDDRPYIQDKAIFNQVENTIKDTNEPVYIHCTTMQNHQPYISNDPNETELEFYLRGVKDMLFDLESFINDLENIDEPTVVLFIGDHYPCFKGEDSLYVKDLNITSENASEVYLQSYFIYNNYDVDFSNVVDGKISAFYLPYTVLKGIGAPQSAYIQTMMGKMDTVPVYSTMYDDTVANDEVLDMLSYDIVVGEQYVKGNVNEKDSD